MRSIVNETGRNSTARRDGDKQSAVWIKRAAKFLRAYRRCEPDNDLTAQLALRDPAMFWAHNIWTDSTSPTRWAIEAQLLARQTDREIAFSVGCGVEAITAFSTPRPSSANGSLRSANRRTINSVGSRVAPAHCFSADSWFAAGGAEIWLAAGAPCSLAGALTTSDFSRKS